MDGLALGTKRQDFGLTAGNFKSDQAFDLIADGFSFFGELGFDLGIYFFEGIFVHEIKIDVGGDNLGNVGGFFDVFF